MWRWTKDISLASIIVVAFALAMPIGFVVIGSARTAEQGSQKMNVPDTGDYSRFQHASEYHARLPCLVCHRRNDNSARMQFPGAAKHAPCAGCHVKQFADSGNAICTICHDNAQSGSLKAFPRLKSFGVKFEHTVHGGNCAGCHRSARGGVALTIPSGPSAHVTCFQCHGPNARSGERDISSCGLCHESGRLSRASQNARAFRVGFSHADHNQNERLACSACHRAVTGGGARDITAPQPLNHHARQGSLSCMSCHNGKRAFGGDDFSVCKRCHQGSAWRF